VTKAKGIIGLYTQISKVMGLLLTRGVVAFAIYIKKNLNKAKKIKKIKLWKTQIFHLCKNIINLQKKILLKKKTKILLRRYFVGLLP